MKTPVKILLGLVALVVLGLLLVIVAVAVLVDPNDYRDDIEQAVQAQTGRELKIDGELTLSLWPCCGLALGPTSLSNPPGFDTPQFASIRSARLGLQVWPLLTRRELVIGEIELAGLDLTLLRRADGRDNWTFDGAAEEDGPGPGEGAGEGPGLNSLRVGGVNITEAQLRLRDDQNRLDYRLTDLRLVTGSLEPGEPFDLDTGFHFTDATDGSEADVSLTSRATVDLAASSAQLAGLRGQASLQGALAGGGQLDLDLQAESVAVDTAADPKAVLSGLAATVTAKGGAVGDGGEATVKFTMPSLEAVAGDTVQLTSGALEADVRASGGSLGKGGQAQLKLAAPGARLTSGKTLQAGLTKPRFELDAQGGELPVPVKGSGQAASLGLDGEAYTLDGLEAKLEAGGTALQLTAAGRYAGRGTRLAGRVDSAEFSPRDWLEKLGQPVPVTADPKVLTRAKLGGAWQLGDDRASISDLVLQFDDTRVTGNAGVTNFSKPAISFKLAGDTLDLDRYLAPESEGGDGAAPADDGSAQDTTSVRDLQLDGQLSLGRLTVNGLQLTELAAQVAARDGVIRLEPATAKLYSGSYAGSVVLDLSGDTPRLSLDQSLQGVQSQGLLTDLAEMSQLTGVLGARLKASGSGNTSDALLRSLDGTLSFQLDDGVYQGLDVWQSIRSARARLRREQPPAATGPAETKINALNVDAKLAGGVMKSQRMVAEIPFLRLTGTGELNLLSQALNYQFQAKVFETPKFADGESYDDLTGRSLPLTVTGTVENPKVGVDLAAVARDVAVEKLSEKLFDRLGLGKEQQQPAPTQPGSAEAPAGSQQAAPQQAPAEQQPTEQPTEQQPKQEDPREALKRSLRDLLDR